MAVQHERRQVPGPGQQLGVGGEVGKAQQRRARLTCPQELTRPANVQVAPGNFKTILRLGHGFEARARGLAQAGRVTRGIQQHTGRGRRTAPDPAAQLVQLRQAKALGMLNDHERGIGHIHTHLNHGGADQHAGLPGVKALHHGFFLRLRDARMQQRHLGARQGGAERFMGFGGVAQIQRLAFFDERAHPVDLSAFVELRSNALDHLVPAAVAHHLGHDGRAAWGQLVDGGDIEVGVVTHGQRARNGCGRHHQQMRLLRGITGHFASQCQSLGHAKAVLLVDDGQRQILELHLVLNDRVRAHHQASRAAFNGGQGLATLGRFLTARQPSGLQPQGF